MKKLNLKELNTLELQIKKGLKYACDTAYFKNGEEGTNYSVPYFFGHEGVGDPSYLLKMEGEEFWKELLSNMTYPSTLGMYYGERDFTIEIVENSTGFSEMLNLVENFKKKEGFNEKNIETFLRYFRRGE